MILIDAVHINNGGGKVLLDYLILQLESLDKEICYLFDIRIKIHNYNIKKSNKIFYARPNLQDRYYFYKANKDKFSKVFILGNIPPMTKVNAEVITYFHNPMYINVPSDFKFLEKIKYKLKIGILKFTSQYTDQWFIQTETIKQEFIEKFGQEWKIKVLPFYPELILSEKENIKREFHTFFYVSNAQANKNHIRLIEAFCKAYDETRQGKLVLTVSEAYPNVISLINQKIMQGYPIENIGFVDRKTLTKKYAESQYVIFPSLAESFGLGLIEGILLGCKIIGADLPYTFAVCEPSLLFDPFNIKSIKQAIIQANNNELNKSILKINNEINQLIKCLS